MSKNLTMEQLATDLQLSRRVISAVLNNRCREMRISRATESRVREHLNDTGFVRSKSAVQLKNGPDSKTIGILYCGQFIDLHYLTVALKIFTREIQRKCGVSEIIGVDSTRPQRGLRECISKGVRKLIWIHANPSPDELVNAENLIPLFQHLDRVVIFKFDFSEQQELYLENGIHLIGFNQEGSYREVRKLLRREGHRKVALNEIRYKDGTPLPGHMPLLNMFEDDGFEVFGLYPENPASEEQTALEIAANLEYCYRHHGIKAAFLRNDLLAARVMRYLLDHGIRVPQDIAIIGYSGSPYSHALPTPLTTFEHPIEAMCVKALELLETELDGKAECHIFDNQLILRNSHGPTNGV